MARVAHHTSKYGVTLYCEVCNALFRGRCHHIILGASNPHLRAWHASNFCLTPNDDPDRPPTESTALSGAGCTEK